MVLLYCGCLHVVLQSACGGLAWCMHADHHGLLGCCTQCKLRWRLRSLCSCYVCWLQADFAAVVNSLAARQDQLAEAVTQLAEAVQNLNTSKQQQQQHAMSGVSFIPWL